MASPTCPSCGGQDAVTPPFSARRMSLLAFLLFGWIYMMVYNAFVVPAFECSECGHMWKRRTAGSWLCLILLLFLVFAFVVLLIAGDYSEPER